MGGGTSKEQEEAENGNRKQKSNQSQANSQSNNNSTAPEGCSPTVDTRCDSESAIFEKVLVRLEHGCVPNRDIGSLSDPCVTVRLLDTPAWPDSFFGGYCKPLEDQSDLNSLTEHTFSEKSNTLDPVWFEECMLMFYRPPSLAPPGPGPVAAVTNTSGTEGPAAGSRKVKLALSCVDKDPGPTDDSLITHFEVDIEEVYKKQQLQQHNDDDDDEGGGGSNDGIISSIPSTSSSSSSPWVRIEAPCDCPGSEVHTHKIVFSLLVVKAEERIVSKELMETAGLNEKVLELKKGNLSGGGRAVVLWKTKPGNKKVFFWLPGLNASFHHIHVMNTLLNGGWDVYTVDCRRMGRAKKFHRELDPQWDPLNAHTTANFTEYCEEVDAMINLADENKSKDGELPEEGNRSSSSGYERRVLYGNSTGALTCVTYLKHGKYASKIDGLALNGPFFDWHLAAYAEVLMNSAFLTDVYASVVVGHGGTNVLDGKGISPYSLKTWAQYYYDVSEESLGLRSVPCLNTTAEWAKAVTAAQKALKADGERKPFLIPIFVISSASDEWVSSEEALTTSDFL